MDHQVKGLAVQDRWLNSIPRTHSEVREQALKAVLRQSHVCHMDTCALALCLPQARTCAHTHINNN